MARTEFSAGEFLRVEGTAETLARLEGLETRIIGKLLTQATRAAGGVIVRAAKKNAPVRTGRFKKTLGQSVRLIKWNGSVEARIGQVKKKRKTLGAMHLHIIENPTRPHLVARPGPPGTGMLIWQHPGTRGSRFFKTTWALKSAKAEQVFEKTLRKGIDKYIAEQSIRP